MSVYQVHEGLGEAFGKYKHQEGAKVLQSYTQPTPSYAQETGTDFATSTAIGVATMGAMKGAYKLAEKSIAAARNSYPQMKEYVSDLSDSVAMTLGFGAKPATVASGVGSKLSGNVNTTAPTSSVFAKKAASDSYTATTGASRTASKAEKASTSGKKGVKSEVVTKKTATEVVAENPYILRSYIREVESITGRKIDPKQLTKLKETLQKSKFTKLSKEAKEEHRDNFDKVRKKVIADWEKNTGQEWTTYKKDVYNVDYTKKLRKKGGDYDGHHMIPVEYGGPNESWNIHPAHGIDEHPEIHAKDSIFRAIFNSKKHNE